MKKPNKKENKSSSTYKKKYLSGFNTYKKSLFYQNPSNSSIYFYAMKNL